MSAQCEVYWGSHGCCFERDHDEPCECNCCRCENHPDPDSGCVAKPPYYGPDTVFYGKDAAARGLPTESAADDSNRRLLVDVERNLKARADTRRKEADLHHKAGADDAAAVCLVQSAHLRKVARIVRHAIEALPQEITQNDQMEASPEQQY